MADLLTSVAGKGWRDHPSYGAGQRRITRIAMGIDSLTAGGGTVSSTYRTTFMGALRAKYGNAGYGWSKIDDLLDGAATFTSATCVGITSLDWADAKRVTAAFGGGVYCLSQTTASLFVGLATADPNIVAGSLDFMFTDAGQSFQLLQRGSTGQTITISASNYSLNVPQRVTIPFVYGGSNQSGFALQNVNTNGANYLYVYGKEFHYSNSVAGVDFANLGTSGTKMSDWAGLDETAFTKWLRIVRPDYFLLNGGINDRGSSLTNSYTGMVPTAVTFQRSLETVLRRIQAAIPPCKVMLVIPNETSDMATTALSYMDEIIAGAATAYGHALHDDRAVLGTYAAALAAGYMDGIDGIHPTPSGNSVRGNAYAGRFALAP